ncbi:MAG: hypothetical protein U1G07_12500 [Verrucomicrobiota bacterium]
MKTKLLLPAALLVLLLSRSTHAIQVDHVEDSITRTWFTVLWGASPTAPLAFLHNGLLSDAGAIDHDSYVHVDRVDPFNSDSFDITFATGERLLSTATVTGFAGVQLLPISGTDYGVQVVYGNPVPVDGVPDTAATSGLLCLSVAVLAMIQKRARPTA